ncbi:MAG: S8 family peptidase [Deltaproteobacteria bacterium]
MPEHGSYPHLPLQRENPVTEKRAGQPPRFVQPENPASHGRSLQQRIEQAKIQTDMDQGGFDERRLFRFTVAKGFDPDTLRNISSDIEFVSQEDEQIIVAFVSDAALESFEARLASLVAGEQVKYKQVLYDLQGVDGWSPEDRKGWALRREGLPSTSPFLLDIELWPLEDRQDERTKLWQTFEAWLTEHGIEKLDSVKHSGLTLYRVRCDHSQAKRLLHHRDVRTVDLPPRYGLELQLLHTDIQDLPEIQPPTENVPGVVILDSGLTTGHPLLASAVGDSQSYLPDKDATDENGHGTHVAGLALYGDVEGTIRERRLVPELRLFSGRILDENNENNTGFVENQITEAVRYFHGTYGCKIFNLSFGDQNKPYIGGHVKGIAYTLDTLSRELGVLFVVSSGNVLGSQLDALEWKSDYPQYLWREDWAILDPAPALNALTVGSLARYDQTIISQRHTNDPAEIPIARRDQPSPFSRRGPSVGGAIKPELVAYGGNWAVNTRAGANMLIRNSLGELSTNNDFVGGHLLAEQSGTSMAAPQVAHLAARLLSEHPQADPNLLRTLLVAHATIPEASRELCKEDTEKLRRICGYGRVDTRTLSRSLENEVTLLADARIANKRHHFYEVPIPDEFVSTGRRLREITVALAYTPYVRSTRIAYKASRIYFRVVAAPNLDHVSTMFNKATEQEDYKNIAELSNPDVSFKTRGKGTVQKATWCFKQFYNDAVLRTKRLFVVVTRNDHPWGELHSATEESYALVVCLRDRENEQAQLYTKIRNKLQARTRERARV